MRQCDDFRAAYVISQEILHCRRQEALQHVLKMRYRQVSRERIILSQIFDVIVTKASELELMLKYIFTFFK